MKQFLLLCLISFTLFSCNKEDVTCDSGDYAGTYISDGTTCLFDMEEVTLTISSSGSDMISLKFDSALGSINFGSSFSITECTFTQDIVDSGSDTDFTLTGTLDGKKITLEYNGLFQGNGIFCTEKYKK